MIYTFTSVQYEQKIVHNMVKELCIKSIDYGQVIVYNVITR